MSLEALQPDYEEPPRGMTDEEFQGLLNEETWDKVHHIALSKTNNYHDAQDVAQLAYIRAFNHKGKFRGDSKPETWLYRITINAAWTYLDKRNKHANHADVDDWAEDIPNQEATVHELYEEGVLGSEVDRALESLSVIDKEFVVLSADKYSHKEIAEHYGLTTPAVKRKIYRARKALRKIVEWNVLIGETRQSL